MIILVKTRYLELLEETMEKLTDQEVKIKFN